MFRFGLWSLLASMLLASSALAQEHSVKPIEAPPPTDGVSADIMPLISPTGFQVVKGESRVVAEFWLLKELPLPANAQTGADVIYPLTPGQLVGIARYPRKGSDFRDQDIPKGVYTVRYGQQPVDGAHVGTSPTRDFLVLTPAEKDQSAAPLDYKTLVAGSKETTGTAHPAILSLQRPAEGGEALAIREESDKEWVIVRFRASGKQGAEAKPLPMELVVVGVAAE